MPVPDVTLEIIDDFLAQKRIAMVGLSRQPKDFSAQLFEELCRRGYDVVPVNPAATEVLGRPCFARVQDIQPPVAAALLMTAPAITETVVGDCAEAGIRRVWMYRAGGQGAVSAKAVEFCRERGIEVVPGQCPLMFLPGAGAIHRFHGLIRKLTGRYPGVLTVENRALPPPGRAMMRSDGSAGAARARSPFAKAAPAPVDSPSTPRA